MFIERVLIRKLKNPIENWSQSHSPFKQKTEEQLKNNKNNKRTTEEQSRNNNRKTTEEHLTRTS